MTYRIIGTLIVLISILILPYWSYVPFLLVAMVYFPFYWEGIFLAFLIDILYGNGIGTLPSLVSPSALLALILLVILLPLRERLRSYA